MLLLLAIIFIGMASLVLEMSLGEPPPGVAPVREGWWLMVGPLALAALVLLLGVYLPQPLRVALAAAAAELGGGAP
jgi:hypothetical protein